MKNKSKTYRIAIYDWIDTLSIELEENIIFFDRYEESMKSQVLFGKRNYNNFGRLCGKIELTKKEVKLIRKALCSRSPSSILPEKKH